MRISGLKPETDWRVRLSMRRPSRDEYREFCRANPELRVERNAMGEVIVMPPAHSRTGRQNQWISQQLGVWADRDGTGIAFDSSSGFDLPNGSNRSPDASWVLRSRIDALSPEDRDEYLPLCPDFVIELRSRSDRLAELNAKMREYLDCGARLGWLIDPLERAVTVFEPNLPPHRLESPPSISGDPVLPGFVLHLERVWDPEL